MSFRPKYFDIYELVPPNVIDRLSNPWVLFDSRILHTADRLRERYGPMVVNNWDQGGNFQLSGWRPGDCSVGALFSQHKYGRALDLKPQDIDAESIRQDILADPWNTTFAYITCVELDVSWLHIDCRNWDKLLNGILTIKP